MDKTAPESLIEHFSKLEDPRVDRNKKHELIDVIVLCVCAVVSGAEGWSDIEEFGRTKLEWLRRYVPLANGIPVDDTICANHLGVVGTWISGVLHELDGGCCEVEWRRDHRSGWQDA